MKDLTINEQHVCSFSSWCFLRIGKDENHVCQQKVELKAGDKNLWYCEKENEKMKIVHR